MPGHAHRAADGHQHQLNLLLEAIGDCARFAVDSSGRIQSWNHQAKALWGYRAADVVGQTMARLGFTASNGRVINPKRIVELASKVGLFEMHGRCMRSGRKASSRSL